MRLSQKGSLFVIVNFTGRHIVRLFWKIFLAVLPVVIFYECPECMH